MNAAPGPLAGRRVINTRPRRQAPGFSEMLRARGAVPVEIPMIEVREHPDEIERLAALPLDRFEWLVVTSPNGAEVVNRVFARRRWPRVAAVGDATAAALHHPSELVPRRHSGAGLVAEFPHGRGEVLVVQSAQAAPTIVEGLRAAGWTPTSVGTHGPVSLVPTQAERAAARGADALTLASGSAARAWAATMAEATPPVVVAIGPECAAAAVAAGLAVTVTSPDHHILGIIEALSQVFCEQRRVDDG